MNMNIPPNRPLFELLKTRTAEAAAQESQDAVLSSRLGEEETLTVIDKFQVSAPGWLVGHPSQESVELTIDKGSVLDNRPETPDVVKFEMGDHRFALQEVRVAAESRLGHGGLRQTEYILHHNPPKIGGFISRDSMPNFERR